jgi:hypothetical protein
MLIISGRLEELKERTGNSKQLHPTTNASPNGSDFLKRIFVLGWGTEFPWKLSIEITFP